MESRTACKWNERIYHQACEWFVEFRTGEPGDTARQAFHSWLQESPAHMAAYLEVAALWSDSEAVNRNSNWQPTALIEAANRDSDNVVTLSPIDLSSRFVGNEAALDTKPTSEVVAVEAQSVVVSRQRTLTRWFATAIAASMLLALAVTTSWFYVERGTYATDVGEQRSITLDDGSVVELNSQSKVRVRYTEQRRSVDLIRGQALFQVAKNVERPFVVSADAVRVRAVGTRFDVYKKGTGTIVTVVEGRVGIRPSPTPSDSKRLPDAAAAAPAAEILLGAGEQLALTGTERPAPKAINVALATAWTQRQLVFASTPLSEVAAEFNRYNKRRLLIRADALNEFEIDGVFSSTDPASLIRFLRERPGVRVTETDDEIVISSD